MFVGVQDMFCPCFPACQGTIILGCNGVINPGDKVTFIFYLVLPITQWDELMIEQSAPLPIFTTGGFVPNPFSYKPCNEAMNCQTYCVNEIQFGPAGPGLTIGNMSNITLDCTQCPDETGTWKINYPAPPNPRSNDPFVVSLLSTYIMTICESVMVFAKWVFPLGTTSSEELRLFPDSPGITSVKDVVWTIGGNNGAGSDGGQCIFPGACNVTAGPPPNNITITVPMNDSAAYDFPKPDVQGPYASTVAYLGDVCVTATNITVLDASCRTISIMATFCSGGDIEALKMDMNWVGASSGLEFLSTQYPVANESSSPYPTLWPGCPSVSTIPPNTGVSFPITIVDRTVQYDLYFNESTCMAGSPLAVCLDRFNPGPACVEGNVTFKISKLENSNLQFPDGGNIYFPDELCVGQIQRVCTVVNMYMNGTCLAEGNINTDEALHLGLLREPHLRRLQILPREAPLDQQPHFFNQSIPVSDAVTVANAEPHFFNQSIPVSDVVTVANAEPHFFNQSIPVSDAVTVANAEPHFFNQSIPVSDAVTVANAEPHFFNQSIPVSDAVTVANAEPHFFNQSIPVSDAVTVANAEPHFFNQCVGDELDQSVSNFVNQCVSDDLDLSVSNFVNQCIGNKLDLSVSNLFNQSVELEHQDAFFVANTDFLKQSINQCVSDELDLSVSNFVNQCVGNKLDLSVSNLFNQSVELEHQDAFVTNTHFLKQSINQCVSHELDLSVSNFVNQRVGNKLDLSVSNFFNQSVELEHQDPFFVANTHFLNQSINQCVSDELDLSVSNFVNQCVGNKLDLSVSNFFNQSVELEHQDPSSSRTPTSSSSQSISVSATSSISRSATSSISQSSSNTRTPSSSRTPTSSISQSSSKSSSRTPTRTPTSSISVSPSISTPSASPTPRQQICECVCGFCNGADGEDGFDGFDGFDLSDMTDMDDGHDGPWIPCDGPGNDGMDGDDADGADVNAKSKGAAKSKKYSKHYLGQKAKDGVYLKAKSAKSSKGFKSKGAAKSKKYSKHYLGQKAKDGGYLKAKSAKSSKGDKETAILGAQEKAGVKDANKADVKLRDRTGKDAKGATAKSSKSSKFSKSSKSLNGDSDDGCDACYLVCGPGNGNGHQPDGSDMSDLSDGSDSVSVQKGYLYAFSLRRKLESKKSKKESGESANKKLVLTRTPRQVADFSGKREQVIVPVKEPPGQNDPTASDLGRAKGKVPLKQKKGTVEDQKHKSVLLKQKTRAACVGPERILLRTLLLQLDLPGGDTGRISFTSTAVNKLMTDNCFQAGVNLRLDDCLTDAASSVLATYTTTGSAGCGQLDGLLTLLDGAGGVGDAFSWSIGSKKYSCSVEEDSGAVDLSFLSGCSSQNTDFDLESGRLGFKSSQYQGAQEMQEQQPISTVMLGLMLAGTVQFVLSLALLVRYFFKKENDVGTRGPKLTDPTATGI
eukprot:g14402.t1